MKKIDSKGKSSVFYIGKGIIILSVITASSLGFLLGFFVGKNMQPPAANQTPVVMPPVAAAPQNTDPLKQEALSSQPQHLPESPKGVQPAVQASQPTQENRQPDKTHPTDKSGQMQEKGKVQVAQATAVTKKYAVQTGAFKNASEANTLKAKLNTKGYKAFIATIETKKHEKLYRVLVGGFGKRNEAELLAVRIRKTEGLRTFVTVRNQEELRSQ